MNRLIFVGLFCEGPTDPRFLESVAKRTLNNVVFECDGDFEIELVPIEINKTGLSFVEQVLSASQAGVSEHGIMILCVHTDADQDSNVRALTSKINPAQEALLTRCELEYCHVLTPIVPVQMVESWMLADKELLKREIGTNKGDNELGIQRNPEEMADPKAVIQGAIRIARMDFPKRRRRDLEINDIYLPIGQKLELERLRTLPSYVDFENAIRDSLRRLNFLHQ